MSKYMPIIAGMATTSEREDAMIEALKSIAPQVDMIYVYVNDGISSLKRNIIFRSDKIAFLDGPSMFGDLGDAGKFVMATNKMAVDRHAYFFGVDDDIIYPSDYTSYLVSKINDYNGRYAVGLHGKIILAKVNSFYRDRVNIRWYHNQGLLSQDTAVHLLGTGLVAFRLDTMIMRMEELKMRPRNAADIHFALACQRNQVGMVCVAHDAGYIKLSNKIDHGKDTIYAKSVNNDQEHTDAVNQIDWRFF